MQARTAAKKSLSSGGKPPSLRQGGGPRLAAGLLVVLFLASALSVGTSAQMAGTTEQEPNDAALSAMPVERGTVVTGEVRSTYDVDPSMDTDYFTVWVEAGEPISVAVTRRGGVGTLYAVVIGPNGLSEPSGDWLADVATVGSGGTARLESVARQSGRYYVMVSGWIYLIDYDLYFNDGGNGAYTVEIGGGTGSGAAPAGEATTAEPRRQESTLDAGAAAAEPKPVSTAGAMGGEAAPSEPTADTNEVPVVVVPSKGPSWSDPTVVIAIVTGILIPALAGFYKFVFKRGRGESDE